jgi:hypothetical protein
MLRRPDTPQPILARRERSRRARARAARGDVVFQVEANRDAVLIALIESGKLSERETRDRSKVNATLSKMLQEWSRHWHEGALK